MKHGNIFLMVSLRKYGYYNVDKYVHIYLVVVVVPVPILIPFPPLIPSPFKLLKHL